MIVDFSAQLGLWPKEYTRQIEYFNRMKTMLQTVNNFVTQNAGYVVLLSQVAEPIQAEWEAAWVAQTGEALPIPPSAQLHWWRSDTATFGGLFGTVEGNATVYRREHVYPLGGTLLQQQDSKTDLISVTTAIGTNPSNYPALSIDLPVACTLYMRFQAFVTVSVSTPQFGADFSVDGVSVAQTYHGAAANMGLVNSNITGILTAEYTLQNVAAGAHTIQVNFGLIAGTTGTVTLGGITATSHRGARQLIARAFIPTP